MEIKTRFKIGDKVYYYDNGIKHGYIQSFEYINIQVGVTPSGDETDNNIKKLWMDELYASRTECDYGETNRPRANEHKYILLKTLKKILLWK